MANKASFRNYNYAIFYIVSSSKDPAVIDYIYQL
jgi:hypothetical protein